jgi:hypothetical protein
MDTQLWQLYQNFSSSASDANKINPTEVTSSTPFMANEGGAPRMEPSTHDFSQSQNMMAQYLQMQMQLQMQMLPNPHLGGSSASPNSNETPARSNNTTTRGASDAVNQLMLHSKVEPFQRANSSTVEDEDLWKVFDDEVSDLLEHSGDHSPLVFIAHNSPFPTTIYLMRPQTSSFYSLALSITHRTVQTKRSRLNIHRRIGQYLLEGLIVHTTVVVVVAVAANLYLLHQDMYSTMRQNPSSSLQQ